MKVKDLKIGDRVETSQYVGVYSEGEICYERITGILVNLEKVPFDCPVVTIFADIGPIVTMKASRILSFKR